MVNNLDFTTVQIFLLFEGSKALLKSLENNNLILIGYINFILKNVLNSGFIIFYKLPVFRLCGCGFKYVI